MTDPVSVIGGLQLRTQVFVVVVGLGMLLVVLNMVRGKRLREQYALLWLLSAVVLTLCALFIRQVDTVAHALGIYYPPAFLFLVAIVLLLMLQLHFSTVISDLREQTKSLTQDLGILSAEVRELRKRLGERETPR
jgi:hypothetical protein